MWLRPTNYKVYVNCLHLGNHKSLSWVHHLGNAYCVRVSLLEVCCLQVLRAYLPKYHNMKSLLEPRPPAVAIIFNQSIVKFSSPPGRHRRGRLLIVPFPVQGIRYGRSLPGRAARISSVERCSVDTYAEPLGEFPRRFKRRL